MLGNQMVTGVRQRALREQHGRRGMKVDPAWAHRRLLLRGGDQLGPKTLARLKTVLSPRSPGARGAGVPFAVSLQVA